MKKLLSLLTGLFLTAATALAVPPAPAPVADQTSTFGLAALACVGLLAVSFGLKRKASASV